MRQEEKKAAPILPTIDQPSPPPPPPRPRPPPANPIDKFSRRGVSRGSLLRVKLREANQVKEWTLADDQITFKEAKRKTRNKLRKEIENRMSNISVLLAIFSLIAILSSMILLHVSWQTSGYSHNSCEGMKWFTTLLTLVTILLLFAKYRLLAENIDPAKERMFSEIPWDKLVEKKISFEGGDNLSRNLQVSHISWRHLFLEIMFNILHAPPTAHPMLSVFTFFRVYHIVGLLRFVPAIQRVRRLQFSAGQKATQSFWGTTKLYMRRYPLHSLAIFFLVSLPTMSYAIFSIERYDASQIKDNDGYLEWFNKYHSGSEGWFDTGSGLNSYSKVMWVTVWMLFMRDPYQNSINGRIPALMLGFISLTFFIMIFIGILASLDRSVEKMSRVDDAIQHGKYENVKKHAERYVYSKWRWQMQRKRLKNVKEARRSPNEIKKVEDSCQKLYDSWTQSRLDFKKARMHHLHNLPSVNNGLIPKIGSIRKTSSTLLKNIENLQWRYRPMLTKLNNMLHLVESNANDGSIFAQVNERLAEEVKRSGEVMHTKTVQAKREMRQLLDTVQQDTVDGITKVQSNMGASSTETLNTVTQATSNLVEQMQVIMNQQERSGKELQSFREEITNCNAGQVKLQEIMQDLTEQLDAMANTQQGHIMGQLNELEQQIDSVFSEWDSNMKTEDSDQSADEKQKTSVAFRDKAS